MYARPLVQFGPDRPSEAMILAGGWCWFTHVAIHARGAPPHRLPAHELPAEIRDTLTRPRPAIAGLTMDQPRLMGILNVTPDSFSDGGLYMDPAVAAAHGQAMRTAGADIIDIGGESTRPGAADVSIDDEIARTAPVIRAIRAQSDVPISIDTRKAAVATAAIAAGAGLVNDVAAFSYDPALADVTAHAGVPACLMHAQGDPATMQRNPHYDDVLLDVYDYLASRVAQAVAAGIPHDQIIVDPGIGFGKTLDHNLALLRGLSLFHCLGCPVLLGASRKRFIGAISGADTAADRMAGSVAVGLDAVRQGVQFLRVHDTLETRQALDLTFAINGTVAQ